MRSRLDARAAELQALRRRIDDFEAAHRAELDGRSHGHGDLFAGDPAVPASA